MSRMDNTELPHPKEIDNETLLPAAERRVNSQALLGPDGKVIIDHNGQEYRSICCVKLRLVSYC